MRAQTSSSGPSTSHRNSGTPRRRAKLIAFGSVQTSVVWGAPSRTWWSFWALLMSGATLALQGRVRACGVPATADLGDLAAPAPAARAGGQPQVVEALAASAHVRYCRCSAV